MITFDAITRRSAIGSLLAISTAGFQSASAQQRIKLTFASAGKGSAFLPFGEAMASTVARHSPIDIAVRETKGSNENAELVNRGEVEIAALNMGPGYDAWAGQGPFSGKPLRGMRAIAPMYETPFHTIVLRDSGITSLRDLAGKRVGVGPSGGPGEVFFNGMAQTMGLNATLVGGTPSEIGARVLSRDIDAFWYGSGLPSPPFADLANKTEVTVFGFSAEEADGFRKRFPYFAPYEIASGTYRGQSAPLASMAVWNFIVANEKLPDEVAYQLTKTVLEQANEISSLFKAASAMATRNAHANSFMPFHLGATRYYRERGVTLPTLAGG